MTLPNGVTQDPATPVSGTAAPVVPAATPTAPAGQPAQQAQGTQVPLAALQDERQKRQRQESQLTALQTELEQLKNMIAAQQAPTAPAPMAPQQQQQPQANPVDMVWNNEEMWNRDPKNAVRTSVQAEIMAAIEWYDRQNAALSYQETEVMKKYPDYAEYKSFVDQRLRQIPVTQRTQAGVIEAAYLMARGQNVDRILTRQQQDLIERIRRGENVSGLNPGLVSTPGAAVPQGQPMQLSDEQMKVAAMMGLSPEAYASAIVRK